MATLTTEAERMASLAFRLNELLSTKSTKLPHAALEDLSNSLAEMIGRLSGPITDLTLKDSKNKLIPSSSLIDRLNLAANVTTRDELTIYDVIDVLRTLAHLLRETTLSSGRNNRRTAARLNTLLQDSNIELERYVQQLSERKLYQDYLWLAEGAAKPYSVHDFMPLKDKGLLILVDSPGLSFETSAPHTGLGETPADISIDIYLDTNNEKIIDEVIARVDDLTNAMGYRQVGDIEIERGSIFRRSRAANDQVVDELKTRLIKVERAFELAQLDLRQADVDTREADAVNKLLNSLDRVSRACIRVGSVLVIKYPYEMTAEPVVIVRNLSQLELHALGRFPEIQRSPETALQSLAMAVENIVGERRQIVGDSE